MKELRCGPNLIASPVLFFLTLSKLKDKDYVLFCFVLCLSKTHISDIQKILKIVFITEGREEAQKIFIASLLHD